MTRAWLGCVLSLVTACESQRVVEVRDASEQLDSGRRAGMDAGRISTDAGRSDARAVDSAVDAARDDAVSHYDLPWLREQSDAGFVVRANVLIDAPLDRVWSLVRDVNAYHNWSSTLTAEAERIAPGESIQLHIQLLDPPLPRTDSTETIRVVDDDRHAISWGGDFGDGETSTRFQLVEPVERRVRWTTGLLFTPGIGSATLALLGSNLQRAFDQVGAELKAEAEHPP